MKSKKLSICIATLNRALFIGATLESILRQISDDIEIVVVDGASKDNTEQIIKSYQQRYRIISYYRKDKAGGIDADYDYAVEKASGDYCWLLSDDDLLKQGAIDAVLCEIEKRRSLIVVNSEIRNFDLSEVVNYQFLKIEEDRVYNPTENLQFFKDCAQYLTYIGCVVIRREIWLKRERIKYYGSEFAHVGVIFQKQLPDKISVVAKPWIIIRYGNALWSPRGFEMWMFKWPNLIWSFCEIPDGLKNRICPKEPWRKFKIIILYRAKGFYKLDDYKHLLKPRINSFTERLLHRLFLMIPGQIINMLAVAYLSFFIPQSNVAIIDLKNSPFYLNKGKKS